MYTSKSQGDDARVNSDRENSTLPAAHLLFFLIAEVVKCIFGRGNFRQAVKLLVSSVQKQKINRDVILQAFELIAMKTIEESLRILPST